MYTQTDLARACQPPSRPRLRRWARWFVRLLALGLVALGISACGGVQSIPDSHHPVVYGLSMLSPDDGWAVGTENYYQTRGMIAHYQNGQWMLVSLPSDTPGLYSVSMLAADDGWAVGRNGAILHYRQGNWAAVSSPVTYSLRSVFMVSPDDGWAVGGGILHYQQGVWTEVQTVAHDLQSVFMLSAREGWAVGLYGQMVHYTGGQWNLVPQGVYNLNLTGVAFTSPEEGWAVGENGAILHYHAGTWSDASLTPGVADLTAVALVSPSEGWAVGLHSVNNGQAGAIFHYTQGRWVQVNSPTHSAWYALDMLSADNGWAGGTDGTLLQYADGKWC